ncbi:MAG TPA: DUF115 domain-containing protein [Planctomycetes bacterium]|nr:DUF115 domain-containing protein [Planctomycetota bacterium]
MVDPAAPQRTDSAKTSLVCLLGAGLEAEARRLASDAEARIVLVVEPGEDGPDLPYPAVVCRGEADALQSILGMQGRFTGRAIVRSEPGVPEGRERARRFAERLDTCLRSKQLQTATIAKTGPLFVRHGLANLPEVARYPSIHGLDAAFAAKPCVIVSPGPSLSKNLHLVRELKGRALVMTGTHALGAFAHAGIAPDLVLAADAGDLARHLRDSDLSESAAMLVGATCAPETFSAARERGARRIVTFAANNNIDHWIYQPLDEDAGLSTGGSVACSAFSLAVKLGCDPIIFVGQDLSFPDGRFYAEESLDGTSKVVLDGDGNYRLEKPPETTDEYGAGRLEDGTLLFTRDRPTVTVPGYRGGRVLSSEPFQAFLFWFEAAIELLGTERRVWNATEGGARIAGTRQLTLAEALAELPSDEPLDADLVFASHAESFDPELRRNALLEHTRGTRSELVRVLTLAERCVRLAEGGETDSWALSRLAAAERALQQASRSIGCLSVHSQGRIVLATERARDATTIEENLIASAELYRAFRDGARELLDPVSDAIGALGSAI